MSGSCKLLKESSPRKSSPRSTAGGCHCPHPGHIRNEIELSFKACQQYALPNITTTLFSWIPATPAEVLFSLWMLSEKCPVLKTPVTKILRRGLGNSIRYIACRPGMTT